MTDFTAVNARARGLASRLLTRPELEALVALEPSELVRALQQQGKVPFPSAAPLVTVDQTLRRVFAEQLAILSRWSGAAPVLEVFFAELDRRSLRALLRGALGAAPATARREGLLPTPTLPTRVLDVLARAPTPAAVVSHLVAIEHPDAGALSLLVQDKAQPELFALDAALTAGFARRALAIGRRGDEVLRAFVTERVDVNNLTTALVLGASPMIDPAPLFVEGGRELTRPAFDAVAAARGSAPAIRRTLGSTTLEALVDFESTAPSVVERRFLTATLTRVRTDARRQPLSCAPTLALLLSLEAMARDLRRVVWASLEHAPGALVTPGLVTP